MASIVYPAIRCISNARFSNHSLFPQHLDPSSSPAQLIDQTEDLIWDLLTVVLLDQDADSSSPEQRLESGQDLEAGHAFLIIGVCSKRWNFFLDLPKT